MGCCGRWDGGREECEECKGGKESMREREMIGLVRSEGTSHSTYYYFCMHTHTHTPSSGCILLDVKGEDFPTIVQEIVKELVAQGMLPPERVEPVTQVLYKRHKHASRVTLWEKLKKAAHRRGDHLV